MSRKQSTGVFKRERVRCADCNWKPKGRVKGSDVKARYLEHFQDSHHEPLTEYRHVAACRDCRGWISHHAGSSLGREAAEEALRQHLQSQEHAVSVNGYRAQRERELRSIVDRIVTD